MATEKERRDKERKINRVIEREREKKSRVERDI